MCTMVLACSAAQGIANGKLEISTTMVLEFTA